MRDDDRGRAKPGRHAFLDDVAGPPARRLRKPKPPPGIITAGGVDMARAHASGIEVREGPTPQTAPDLPRVMLSIETDTRKVPTHRRHLEARKGAASADGAEITQNSTRADALPEVPRAAAGAGSAGAEGSRAALPRWLRATLVALSLLLLAAVVLRLRTRAPRDAVTTTAPTPQAVRPTPPVPVPMPVPPPPPAAVTEAPRDGDGDRSSGAAPARPAPRAVSSVAPDDDDEVEPHAARRVRPVPPSPRAAPTPASTPAFSPPFQLPSEKN